jgi:hypothetical protein
LPFLRLGPRAAAAPKHQPAQQPGLVRSANGTIIQPTTTIIPDGRGHVRVIVIPRQRSFLDLGTEVSVGDRSFRDCVVAPGGDPTLLVLRSRSPGDG